MLYYRWSIHVTVQIIYSFQNDFWKPSYVLEEYQLQPRSRTLPEAYRRFQKFPEGFQKLHTFYVDVPVNLDLACFRNISRTREYMPLRDGFFSTATQTSCCNRIQRSNRVRLLVVSTHDFPDTTPRSSN